MRELWGVIRREGVIRRFTFNTHDMEPQFGSTRAFVLEAKNMVIAMMEGYFEIVGEIGCPCV